jgi:hypothetical protein
MASDLTQELARLIAKYGVTEVQAAMALQLDKHTSAANNPSVESVTWHANTLARKTKY